MEFFGLVGEKLGHSISPEIHEKIFKELNISAGYKLFEIEKDKISELKDALKLLKIKGVNVTIPYKQEVMNQMDFISREAKEIGAINTILLKEGKLYGYNSDYFGFKIMLEINNIDVKEKTCVLLGTGGAAKAIIAYLKDAGVKKLYVVTRDKNKKLYNDSFDTLIDYKELNNINGDIIINSTPVGMYPHISESPVDKCVIEKYDVLVDIIYNPKLTKFLEFGKELNKKICGGLYMLVGQAVKSEELWNDTVIDRRVIDNIYRDLENKFR